jgi:hypothetical protein
MLAIARDFDADSAALIVVIDNDAIRDFCAILDRAVGQVDVDGIGLPIHSHGLADPLSRVWFGPVEIGCDAEGP